MKIVDPSFAFMAVPDPQVALRHLEAAARTCYKSEDKVAPGSAEALLYRIIHMGHESVLEHVSMTVLGLLPRRRDRSCPKASRPRW